MVDDATHEAIVIEVERAISGMGVRRVMDRLVLSRGLPRVIRSDNRNEFCGKAMVTWAHERGVQPRLIEPGGASRRIQKHGSVPPSVRAGSTCSATVANRTSSLQSEVDTR